MARYTLATTRRGFVGHVTANLWRSVVNTGSIYRLWFKFADGVIVDVMANAK